MIVLCEEFLLYLQARNYSDLTREEYARDIQQFMRFLENASLDIQSCAAQDLRAYSVYLHSLHYKPATVLRKLSALKSFCDYLVQRGSLRKNLFASFPRRKTESRLPRFLSQSDVRKFLDSFDLRNPQELLHKAVFETLYSTGVRVSELVGLLCGDVDLGKSLVRVVGKGRKERFVFLTASCVETLSLYFRTRALWVREKTQMRFFVNVRGKTLSRFCVWALVNSYSGYFQQSVSPHLFRHSFATHMLENGAGLHDLQKLLGHEHLATTQVYTHVSLRYLREVYEKAHPHA